MTKGGEKVNDNRGKIDVVFWVLKCVGSAIGLAYTAHVIAEADTRKKAMEAALRENNGFQEDEK